MASIAQSGESLMTDSGLGVSGSTAMPPETTPGPAPSLPVSEVRGEGPTGRSAAFDACVEDIRRRRGADIPFLFPRLEDQIRRRLGMAALSAGAAVLAGLVGVGIRLALALTATVLAGDWAAIPWGRWAVIVAFYGLCDATQPMRTPPLDVPPGPRIRRAIEDWTALLPTIVHERDLRDLADFTRRWIRLAVAAAMGAAVAIIVLLSCWAFAPAALGELPAGSIVLLALLLYDFGASTVSPVEWVLSARQARYDHRLFWPSPTDTPEVQRAIQMTSSLGWATGMWITLYLGLALVLVSWDSPLVLPLAVGFVAVGYLNTIGTTLGCRAGIHTIVQRARNQRLQGLRQRIEAFEPRYADLSLRESQHVRGLIELHNMIRDAPTTPTATHTLIHAAVGLIIPTVLFVVTVFGEVYAERILDAILP